jgi:hypothetical protein
MKMKARMMMTATSQRLGMILRENVTVLAHLRSSRGEEGRVGRGRRRGDRDEGAEVADPAVAKGKKGVIHQVIF